MRTPTALIADDESALRDHLRRKLAALWPELRLIAEARNGLDAAELIAAHQPDIAFLDIKMPGLTGLEVAQGIEGDTRVVFVTAFDQFALDAFEREAVDYLVKPVDDARLGRTVERLRRALREADPAPELARVLQALAGASAASEGAPALRWIRASRGQSTYHLPVGEVVYFQSDDKYTAVHAAGGEYLIRTPLGELAAGLDPEVFWQVHRSTIVNMHQVKATRRDDSGRLWVQFRVGDAEVPVSRAYAARFRQM